MKIYPLLILLIFSTPIYAQQDTLLELQHQLENTSDDSVKTDILITLHNAYFKKDVQKSYGYAQQILNLGLANKDPANIIRGCQALARCGRKQRNYKTVLHYDSLAYNYAKKMGDINIIYNQQAYFVNDFLDSKQFDNAYQWLMMIKTAAEKINTPKILGNWYKSMGYLLASTNKNKKAIESFGTAMEIFKRNNDKYNTANCIQFIAQCMVALGKTDSVPRLYIQALQMFEELNSQYRSGDMHINLGDVYLMNGNYQKGIEHYNTAIELFRKDNNIVDEGIAMIDLGRAYLYKKNTDTAYNTITGAQVFFDSVDYDLGKIRLKTLWGQYYTVINDFSRADAFFKDATRLMDTSQPDLKIENDKYWAQLKYKMKDFKQADSLLYTYIAAEVKTKEPEAIAKELRMIRERNKQYDSTSLKLLTLLYTPGGIQKIKKQYKDLSLGKALYMDTLMNLSPFSYATSSYDSSMTATYNNQLLKLETQYKTLQINDSLQMARQNILLATTSIKNRNTMIACVAIIALLLAAGLYVQYTYRQRAEKDSARIQLLQNEIHHRIKNNLAIIKRFTEVAEKAGKSSLSLTDLQNRISAIELLHKNLYLSEKSGEVSLQQYLSQLVQIISYTFEDYTNIQIDVNANVHLSMDKAEKVGLIVNELITNSYKYGFKTTKAGNIQINASKTGNNNITIAIIENGEGYNRQTSEKGYGSRLIEGIANELNATFSLNTDNGVSFVMTLV